MSILPERSPTVFEWLDEVRTRPGMFLATPEHGLHQLEALIFGYYSALLTHGFVERAPNMTRHFSTWIRCETGWTTSCGWAHAIDSHAQQRDPLEVFFEFADRYRELKPITLCAATLGRKNRPRGKRVVIGFGGRMQRPSRVEILRYGQTKLFFLRFHYGRRTIDSDILADSSGSHLTSLRFAKRWVAEELGVRRDDWRAIA